MNNEVMFSKKTDQWSTPKELYNEYISMGAFDPCPMDYVDDGLVINWKPLTYVNPPYSNIKGFMLKALEEIEKGHTHLAIFLVPARVDTKWFQELVYGKHAYKFIKGRLKFGDSKNSAPFPSMLIYLT